MKTVEPPTVAAQEAAPLVFQWEQRPRARLRLIGLTALSLLVHAVGFYVLQVAYTPTGSQLPPPVQVMMARPEHPDDPPEVRAQARALNHWLAITDPALPTEPVIPEADRLLGPFVRYVPSYKAAPPPFKPLDPPAAGTAAPPRPRPPGPVPVPSPDSAPHTYMPSPPTRITLTGSLAALAPKPMPAVTFTLPFSAKTLSPSVFLVGVRPEGDDPFVFRETSSGEVSVDDYASDYLARLHFDAPAGTSETIWGWAEFDWGREIYR